MRVGNVLIIAMLSVAVLPLMSVKGDTARTGVYTTVITDKSVYTSLEAINITVTVGNGGTDTVTISFPSSLQLYFCVTSLRTNSTVYNLWQHVGVFWWITYITLEPGQTKSRTYSGTGGYGAWHQESDDGTRVRTPGYYAIEGILNVMGFLEYEVGRRVIAISDNQTAPTAIVTASKYFAGVGEEILFDASTSVDVAQRTGQLEYRWDWTGDGDYDTDWSSISSANHSFSDTGEFSVCVQVRDQAGLQNEATTSVIVDAALPEFPGIALVVLGALMAILAASRTRK